jgi:hypothetical protein
VKGVAHAFANNEQSAHTYTSLYGPLDSTSYNSSLRQAGTKLRSYRIIQVKEGSAPKAQRGDISTDCTQFGMRGGAAA